MALPTATGSAVSAVSAFAHGLAGVVLPPPPEPLFELPPPPQAKTAASTTASVTAPRGRISQWYTPRRDMRGLAVAAVVALGIAAVAVWGWRHAGPVDRAAGPIVLISIDTLRADHLPAYGYSKVRTPAIDALAATATVFEHAYSHAPQTLPAHTCILTGELPFQTGVRDNIGFALKDGQWTLAGALHAKGFAAGGFVS